MQPVDRAAGGGRFATSLQLMYVVAWAVLVGSGTVECVVMWQRAGTEGVRAMLIAWNATT
ncbi:MAG: hypothetical protein ABR510_10130 [Trueperaceae bacterium]